MNTHDIATLIRKHLKNGHTLCVLGWKSSNHDDLTRSLDKANKVKFIDLSGDNKLPNLPQKPVVLLTKFISHADTSKVKQKQPPMHPHPLGMGELRDVLGELAADLAGIKKTTTIDAIIPADIARETTVSSLDDLEALILNNTTKIDRFDKLAVAFTKEAAKREDDLVGARTLGTLLRELEITEKTPALVQAGLLTAVTQVGKKKIGWYKAGPELLQRLQKHVTAEEPTDPLDKATWLLKQEPIFEQRIAELEAQRQYWISQKARVEAAKTLLQQLNDL